jgi:hypothetical protein
VPQPERAQRVDRGGLADALGGERVERCGCLGPCSVEVDQVGPARYQVVGHRRCERLAVAVVIDPLVERLADARSDPAALLPGCQQRVENAPAVVHRDMTPQPHPSGLDVHLDGVTAIGLDVRR